MVAQSGARIALVTTAARSRSAGAGLGVPVAGITRPWAVAPTTPQLAPGAPLPAGTGYLVFTSGSTAAPKVCLGTVDGLANRCRWMRDAFPPGAAERCAARASLSFVDAITELLAPLTAGAELVLVPDELAFDGAALVAALAAYQVQPRKPPSTFGGVVQNGAGVRV